MKHLNQFATFDFGAWSSAKDFICTGQRPWVDRDSGSVLGTVVDAVIFRDNTVYKRKEGDTTTNRFEKISFKVNKAVTVPADAPIRPVNPVATIWGDFRNNLSVKADDIELLPRQQAAPKSA